VEHHPSLLIHGKILIKHRTNFTFKPSQIARLKLRFLGIKFLKWYLYSYCSGETIQSTLRTFRVPITSGGFNTLRTAALMESHKCVKENLVTEDESNRK
jgi:hypothetical protein